MWVNTSGPLANLQAIWEAIEEVKKADDPAVRAYLVVKLRRELSELTMIMKHIETALAAAEKARN